MAHPVVDAKACNKCLAFKPITEYHVASRRPCGYTSTCKECKNRWMAEHRTPEHGAQHQLRRAANPRTKELNRDYDLRKKYKITLAKFEQMLAAQAGVCACCGKVAAGQWCVDHDHSCCPGIRTCGKCVRGILCNGCNVALAWHESHALEAAAYLERCANATAVN